MALAHRVGVVPVGEPSVIIAVSSAHRRESLEVGAVACMLEGSHKKLFSNPQAVAWAIDELKAVVPIWKKEIFRDGSEW